MQVQGYLSFRAWRPGATKPSIGPLCFISVDASPAIQLVIVVIIVASRHLPSSHLGDPTNVAGYIKIITNVATVLIPNV
jgi:hypothetical protein